MVMPMSIKRDSMGFIELDRFRLINYEKVPKSSCFTFIHKGKRYFFKPTKRIEDIYNESIAYEIAKDFGIDAIPYDIASRNGQIGYLSKDCLDPGMIYLEDMLISFYGNDRNKCNLSDVEFMLQERYSEDFAKKISKQLIDLLMFDLIIGNTDRHDRNILINEREEKLGPVFDNELMLNGVIYGDKFCFTLFALETDNLGSFVKFMDDEVIAKFITKIKLVSGEHIKEIFKRVEDRIGAPMNPAIKERLIKRFDIQYDTLVKTVQERKNMMKLNLKRDGDNNASSSSE